MIKAVWDAIIVKADEKNEKMHGKFIIPDMSQEKAIMGTIIDVGPGRWNTATFRPPCSPSRKSARWASPKPRRARPSARSISTRQSSAR